MARSDLLLSLVRARTRGDDTLFKQTVEAIITEERHKQHHTLANQLAAEIQQSATVSMISPSSAGSRVDSLFIERPAYKRFQDLVLSDEVQVAVTELVEEQVRSDLLRSYNIEPRSRLLLLGPPGNGKTSLAEAIAESLGVPFIVVRYDGVIGSFLGETNQRLKQVFDYARTRRCVLFFDEFDTVGKERGDRHDSGEIKRVVSTLLLQIDSLPSHVVVIAATNHQELLDRAVWRRFQIKLELDFPSAHMISSWMKLFWSRVETDSKFNFQKFAAKLTGRSFSDIENINLNILRRIILSGPSADIKGIFDQQISRLNVRKQSGSSNASRRK